MDTRPPEVIFREGFKNLGDVRNFYEHIVSTNFGRSWFVSFAETPTAAMRYFGSWLREYVPGHPREAYLYEVRADQFFYNARTTGENLLDLVMNDDIHYDESDREIAQMAIRALRTSFSYQREWFSDGPVAPTSVRSAWRVDAVPVAPGHAHHPVGRIVETTRINDPEILNESYQEQETEANSNPWNPQAVAAQYLTVPQTFEAGDVSEGASASYSFACPDWHSESNIIYEEPHGCIYENANRYDAKYFPMKAPSYDIEARDMDLILTASKTKANFYLFGYRLPNTEVRVEDITERDKLSLGELEQLKEYSVYYDTQQRLTFKRGLLDDVSFSLTPRKTRVAGVYLIETEVSTNNRMDQKWLLTPLDDDMSKYKVSSYLFRVKNGLYRRRGDVDSRLYLMPDSLASNEYEELILEVSDKKTKPAFITPRASDTHISEIRLEWYADKHYYSPLLTGWSKASHSKEFSIFYDFERSVIFYVSETGETWVLTNKRDKRYYDWDWVQWVKKPISEATSLAEKWYFSLRGVKQPPVDRENFRVVRSYLNNDYLKVIYSGSKWGGWYTSKFFEERNSINQFVISDNFEK
ncbi:ADP-ribosylating toxin CARDS [Mesomycoplasma neurolyticum]|uniref:ADP-ribosylating toxin CARDS n=1 Tax=Mesomycoplasma neurolyticum TaxID=2120 RepID=A0A449A5N1_9BACT|nr:ADP-ribosylating toxin CARDS [Mesomycoplasma neurolyticum]